MSTIHTNFAKWYDSAACTQASPAVSVRPCASASRASSACRSPFSTHAGSHSSHRSSGAVTRAKSFGSTPCDVKRGAQFAIATSIFGSRVIVLIYNRPPYGADQLCPSRAAHRPRADRVHGALAAVRNAAPGDAVDPLARAGRREGVLARVGAHLPERDRRAPAQGALPGLRLRDDRLRVLRLATVAPGERRAGGGALLRPAELRALRQVQRAAEGGAPLHEQPDLESRGRRRRAV